MNGGIADYGASAPASSLDVWTHWVVFRRGTFMQAYVNGAPAGNKTDSALAFNVSANPLRTFVVNSGIGGKSHALLRISATIPTPDQIRKIYEDEKVLFQENAACTIYGSSSQVRALAHDPDTGLLHVGTSAGRSVFQGLRRVDNTTNAVLTAISASNGMVIDE